MAEINWIQKLTSRKFWMALIAFVSALLVAFHVGDNDIAQVSAIISAFGTLVIYILTEGSVDKARTLSNTTHLESVNTTSNEKSSTTITNKGTSV